MTTDELIKKLRAMHDIEPEIRLFALIGEAADRLEELEERVAIMEESKEPIRCYECAWFEHENAEEGCMSGHCRKQWSPCANELVDMTFFCEYAEAKDG